MARLRAVLRIEAGAWLHALPSPHMETLLKDGSMRIAVAPGLQGLRMPFLCLRLCGGGLVSSWDVATLRKWVVGLQSLRVTNVPARSWCKRLSIAGSRDGLNDL